LATRNWLLHQDKAPYHTFFFTWERLIKNNMAVFPSPPYFSLSSRLKTKLKGSHFDTTEAIEAEIQAVLNLTEHDFQDAIKTVTETLGTVHMCGRGLLRG
jgi:hypothetical protein